jgi:hypothetical protein
MESKISLMELKEEEKQKFFDILCISLSIKRTKRYLDDIDIELDNMNFDHENKTLHIKRTYPQITNIITKTKKYALDKNLTFVNNTTDETILEFSFDNPTGVSILEWRHRFCTKNKCTGGKENFSYDSKTICNFKELTKDCRWNTGWEALFHLIVHENADESTGKLTLKFVCVNVEFEDLYAKCK